MGVPKNACILFLISFSYFFSIFPYFLLLCCNVQESNFAELWKNSSESKRFELSKYSFLSGLFTEIGNILRKNPRPLPGRKGSPRIHGFLLLPTHDDGLFSRVGFPVIHLLLEDHWDAFVCQRLAHLDKWNRELSVTNEQRKHERYNRSKLHY